MELSHARYSFLEILSVEEFWGISVIQQKHARHLGYRVVRGLGLFRSLRGWKRCSEFMAPPSHSEEFLVSNDGVYFQGITSSYIDRQMYLFGGYEQQAISLFESVVPRSRREVILDVGANVGTHSLRFSKSFRSVHSFEPNSFLWGAFERNVSLNRRHNVSLHKVGLGEVSADMAFYAIDKANHGLGTFVPAEQYDMPLQERGVLRVEQGDEYLKSKQIGRVDAIKVDVQGFEPEVLRGLKQTLRTYNPVVWFEYGKGTQGKLPSAEEIMSLFPNKMALHLIETSGAGLFYSVKLKKFQSQELVPGDYIAIPGI